MNHADTTPATPSFSTLSARSGNHFHFGHTLCRREPSGILVVAYFETGELFSDEREECSNNLFDDREFYSAPVESFEQVPGSLSSPFLDGSRVDRWRTLILITDLADRVSRVCIRRSENCRLDCRTRLSYQSFKVNSMFKPFQRLERGRFS